MKSTLIALVLSLLAALGLYGKGRVDARKNSKIKDLKDKVRANEIAKDKADNTAADDIAALERVRRD